LDDLLELNERRILAILKKLERRQPRDYFMVPFERLVHRLDLNVTLLIIDLSHNS